MKLSDALKIVGPSFPYYPRLCPYVGGVDACIFLCCVFWKAFEDQDGWVKLTMEQITQETGLSAYEQRRCRSNLGAIIEVREDRLKHQTFYRVNTGELDLRIMGQSPVTTHEVLSPEVQKLHLGECRNSTSGSAETESRSTDKDQDQDPDKTLWGFRVGELNRVFRRREKTAWNEKELKAFGKTAAQAHPDDFSLIVEFYQSDFPYLRKDLQTLLNNWNGELDRAREWKQPAHAHHKDPHLNNSGRPLTGAQQRQIGIPPVHVDTRAVLAFQKREQEARRESERLAKAAEQQLAAGEV